VQHRNIALVQRLFGAFMQGDREAITAGVDPDIRLYQSGHDALSGTYEGAEAVIAHLLGDYGVEEFDMQLIDMLASDTRVAVVARSTGRIGGSPITLDSVQVFRIEGDRIAEIRVFTWDQQALAALLPAGGEPARPA
jgi:uncharacterized protein